MKRYAFFGGVTLAILCLTALFFFNQSNLPTPTKIFPETPPPSTPSLATPTPAPATPPSAWPQDVSVDQTPYDRYLANVRKVLNESSNEEPSFTRVQALMRQGRAFRYAHAEPYVPEDPAVTEAHHAGDCKDKALWLMSKMGGSPRFVIGKLDRGARLSHAWLEWYSDGQVWILDPTMLARPIPREKKRINEYLGLYVYDKKGAYQRYETQQPEPIATK